MSKAPFKWLLLLFVRWGFSGSTESNKKITLSVLPPGRRPFRAVGSTSRKPMGRRLRLCGELMIFLFSVVSVFIRVSFEKELSEQHYSLNNNLPGLIQFDEKLVDNKQGYRDTEKPGNCPNQVFYPALSLFLPGFDIRNC